MMYCQRCGAQLSENTSKCPSCGTENAVENTAITAKNKQTPYKSFFKKKRIVITAIIAIILIAGGITTVFILSEGSSISISATDMLQLANRYLKDMNYEQAIIEFQKILEIEPKNVEAYIGLAEAYVGLGDTDKAIVVLKQGKENTGSKKVGDRLKEIQATIETTASTTELAPAPQTTIEENITTAEETVESTIPITTATEITATTTSTEAITELTPTSQITIAEDTTITEETTTNTTPITTTTEVATTTDTNKLIPNGAYKWNDHYYMIYDFAMEWSEAKEYCNNLGGHLLTISSYEEQEAVNDIIIKFGTSNMYWIGLYLSNEDWSWVNNENFSYANWAIGEPNADFYGMENVVAIYGKEHSNNGNKFYIGEWNDSLETGGVQQFWLLENTGFICEWDYGEVITENYTENKDTVVIAGEEYSIADTTKLQIEDTVLSAVDMINIGQLTNLTFLYLRYNQISDISALSCLNNLTELYLYNNQITDISSLANLTNLIGLGLGDNQINDITSLANLTNLTFLMLSHNQITDISTLAGLANLKLLGLYNNKIIDITPLANLTKLTTLALGINQITDITPLLGLRNLLELNLERNLITENQIEQLISQLPNCKILSES